MFTFCSCRKNGLIRKIRLTSKFIMSHPGKQTISIHTWCHISRSKDKQIMKFGLLIEYRIRNIFSGKIKPKIWVVYATTWCTFQPKLKKLKNPQDKIFHTPRKWNLLPLILDNFLYFLKRKLLLCMRKRKPQKIFLYLKKQKP